MGVFMNSREILEAIFTSASSSFQTSEVQGTLKEKLGLTDDQASSLAGVLRDVGRVGFDNDYAKWNAEVAEIRAFIRTQAIDFAAAAKKLVKNPNASRDEVKAVMDMGYGVEGPRGMAAMMKDLDRYDDPKTAEQTPKEREGVYYDIQGNHQDDIRALVEGAKAIAQEIRIAYLSAHGMQENP